MQAHSPLQVKNKRASKVMMNRKLGHVAIKRRQPRVPSLHFHSAAELTRWQHPSLSAKALLPTPFQDPQSHCHFRCKPHLWHALTTVCSLYPTVLSVPFILQALLLHYPPPLPQTPVRAIAFAPDGSHAASVGSGERSLALWPTSPASTTSPASPAAAAAAAASSSKKSKRGGLRAAVSNLPCPDPVVALDACPSGEGSAGQG